MKRGVVQSIAALIGGFAIMVFLTIALTVAEVAAFGVRTGEPTAEYLAASLLLSAVAAFAGGFATAALAPNRPRAHTTGVAIMVFVAALSSLGNPHPGQPVWYPAALVVLGPSCALLGGFFRRPRAAIAKR